MGRSFEIEFSDRARDNLEGFRKRDQQVIVDAIDVQLTNQPARPTRNRKPLEGNPLAPWELRAGGFRVFYDIDVEEATVVIVAVGRKVGNKLFIGGEEIQL
jgi:mRNA-degrading endonuclease RelE of RelBE toxin-antitoxin system